MLRVAVPNKGLLAEPARQMLAEAGYLRHAGVAELAVTDLEHDVEFFFLRPRDIAIYVGEGTLDLGITGRDMLLDSGAHAREVLRLGFGPSTFCLAAPAHVASVPSDLAGLRIATSYEGLLRTWLEAEGIGARVLRLDGAVENAVALGVADAVADVVATGTTLCKAGLQVIGEPLLRSEALLIRRSSAPDAPPVETFVRRLQSVMVAREFVIVDYDIPKDRLEQACAITPGFESPTISDLRDPGWSAVRAMVPQAQVHRVMDELYDLGARGILVSVIHACRL